MLNKAEIRVHQLYQLLEEGYKPWEWDYSNYSGNKKKRDMRGMFYPKDFNAIRSIRGLIADREASEANKANVPKGIERR